MSQLHCESATPNNLFNPTLDRSIVSLPLHSFAVKRGLTEP